MKCVNCRSNDFVSDFAEGQYTCRVCGAVNNKTLFIEQMQHDHYSFQHSFQNNELAQNYISINANYIATDKLKLKLENRTRQLLLFAEQLDVNESIQNFALVKLKNENIFCRKPIRETLFSLLIVAAREKKYYMNTKRIDKIFLLKNLGKHVIAVSKLLKLSQTSDPIDDIHRYIQLIGLPYKYGSHVKSLYFQAQRCSKLSCDTLIAYILYQTWLKNKNDSIMKNVNAKYVADLFNIKDYKKLL